MDSSKRFSTSVIQQMQSDIQEAYGNEVFWSGKIDEDGIVTSVTVGSRGNEQSVIINRDSARGGNVLIHNHPSGILLPSEADQSVAVSATDSSLGFYIVNNTVSKVYVVLEPIKPRKTVKINEDEAAVYISNNGPFAKKNPSFEERPCQIELLKSITKSFNESKIGVFEAGTGVGKSFAYLIPSILWAAENKERIIISTGTINLQQQLAEKDVPFAQQLTEKKVKSILLKGRQNYICLRRLEEANQEKDLFSNDTELFDTISSWAKNTSTGSRSDLTFVPPESIWSQINSESDACMGAKCPFREKCFVMKLRKEAADANIIIVNHHLLFADIESRMNGAGYDDTAVLPPYKRIVFDEAHGIEDSATSFFSESVTRFSLLKQINLLYRAKKGAKTGFLTVISLLTKDDEFITKVSIAISAIKDKMLALDEIALNIMENSTSLRLCSTTTELFNQILSSIDSLRNSIGDFCDLLQNTIDNLSDDDLDIPAVWETKTVLRRLNGIILLLKNFGEWDEHDDKVFHCQKIRLPPKKIGEPPTIFVEFVQTPLDIAPLMNKGVFEPMKTVICTSATLRTGGEFSYWLRRIGLSFVENNRIEKGIFDSPFPYRTNVLFGVPGDAPLPDSPLFQSYTENAVPKLIEAAGGRTLVLFTSYESLRNTYEASKQYLQASSVSTKITLLKQGDDDRFRLLENFKQDKTSVLFATDSFWEGVDVPGESLSQVIIVKLPFPVPVDPVFMARSEAIEKRGGSSFMELSVPQAIIKFRQGFGRLVRRSDDKGTIIVLDRRIVVKHYGKIFLSSVPMTRRMSNPLSEIIAAEKRFWNL